MTGTTMHALRLVEPGRVEWDEVPAPRLTGPGQVVVETSHATVCGTDLHKVFAGTSRQPYPARPGFPGHESVGDVIESSCDAVDVGQRVLAAPDMAHAGAFAERQVLPERFVVPLPGHGDPARQVLAQQLGTVVWALRRFWPGGLDASGRTAGVLGAGPAGLFFVDLLASRGFDQVIVSDLHRDRLERARERGATTTLRPPEDDVEAAVFDLTDGRGADLVVEAAGEDATRAMSVAITTVDGRVGLFGTPASLEPVAFPVATLFERKPTLLAQHHAQDEPGHRSFRRALELIERGEVASQGVVTHWLAPDRAREALELARVPSAGSLKVGVSFRAAG